ncbi:MAG: TRAP transporter substrate-binding protein DctP [Gammaproteobacteria bacterium]|nr:TRAP transporter substrate-binding protein DctP [Gammaproteobacteria bacterium]
MRIFRLLLAGLLLASVVGNVHAVVFKIATISPDGSLWMRSLREAAATIAEHTEGRATFKFYPGGVMGDDKAVLRKIRLGQLHGAVLTSGGLTNTYTDVQLYNLPMLFRSLQEVDYIRERVDPVLITGLEEQGFVSFGFAEVGFAYAMSQVPVTAVDQVQSQKVWVPDGDEGAQRTLVAFDITPIPLSIADVLGGLQTGLINGVTVPPVAAIALQWHTQLEHVLDLPLLYVYGTLAVNKRQFGKLTDDDQSYIRGVMNDVVRDVNGRNRQDHERAVEVLQNQGLVWNTPQIGEVSQWQSYADKASGELVGAGIVSEPLYREVLQHLTDYRETVD